jgi:tRNA pseudouridine38-40 synthase
MRMLVAYDGSRFRGFAPQPGVRTVGGTLAEAIERHLRHAVVLTCAGRTDAGVHAWGQVVSFDARADVDPCALQRSLNRTLAPEVVIRMVEQAPPGFDARLHANARRYRYTILNRPIADPFLAATSWHVPARLDLAPMRLACDPLLGEHDFASFCKRQQDASSVRVVHEALWSEVGEGVLRFEIQASSFCQQMVRSIVGTLVDVGLGRKRAGDMAGILAAKSRQAAGTVAPPHGLCLWEVMYPPETAAPARGA